MKTGQSILVPLDGSTQALHAIPMAFGLAQEGGRVVLLRVVPEQQGFVSEEMESEYGWFERSDQVQASTLHQELETLANQLRISASFQGEIEVKVRIGDPAGCILDIATSPDFDLIVMTTRGYGAVKRVFFGSVSDRVAHHATIPVLIVRAGDELDLFTPTVVSGLLVMLDGSGLAEHAIPIVRGMAQSLAIPVTLVRAIHVNAMLPAIHESGTVLQDLIERDTHLAALYLMETSKRMEAGGLEIATAVRLGSPTEVVASLAKPGDLVVLTSHGRTGVKRWLLGSVAEKLVRTSTVPVLLVPVRAVPAEGQRTGR